jgi:uronate dehydrogenase
MGRMYWLKHGVESVLVRIGSCFPEVTNARMLSTWLSYGDLTQLCIKATLAPTTGCIVVWGASANARTYWRRDARDSIGWAPQDSADQFAGQMAGKVGSDPIEERYQGGGYTSDGYTRRDPPPGKLFG